MIMAARFADTKEVLLRRPGKGADNLDDVGRRGAPDSLRHGDRRLRRHRHRGWLTAAADSADHSAKQDTSPVSFSVLPSPLPLVPRSYTSIS